MASEAAGRARSPRPSRSAWPAWPSFLSQGGAALGRYALAAAIVFGILGILMAVFERRFRFIPSPTAVGVGMVVPSAIVVTMVIGGIVAMLWGLADPKSSKQLAVPLASGMMAGEALVAVILPMLVALHILSATAG